MVIDLIVIESYIISSSLMQLRKFLAKYSSIKHTYCKISDNLASKDWMNFEEFTL